MVVAAAAYSERNGRASKATMQVVPDTQRETLPIAVLLVLVSVKVSSSDA